MKQRLNLQTALLLGSVLLPALTLASGGEHGEAHGGLTEATIKTIIYQVINVGILVAGLVYFTRATIRAALESRKKAYLEATEKAQNALRKAEEERRDLQDKLTKLEATRRETVARAEAEAADLRKNIIEEARQIAANAKKEAEEASRIEVAKAQRQIREFMIEQARATAEKQLKSGISQEDHQKLTGKFITNIEAAQT